MRIYSDLLPVPILLSILGLAASTPAAAIEIYQYVDSQGRVHLTDRPPDDRYQLIQKDGKKLRSRQFSYKDIEANRKRFTRNIARAARRYQVPEKLIHAVIHVESAYNPDAVSSAGAVGLMQLMPGTAKRYGVSDRRDPTENISAGTRYLKDLLLLFDRNLELALAGYNAGENAVKKYGNRVPPFSETQRYVRKVLKLYSQEPKIGSGEV